MVWNMVVENRENFLGRWKQQMQGEDLLNPILGGEEV